VGTLSLPKEVNDLQDIITFAILFSCITMILNTLRHQLQCFHYVSHVHVTAVEWHTRTWFTQEQKQHKDQ